jgi:hypothetical protein
MTFYGLLPCSKCLYLASYPDPESSRQNIMNISIKFASVLSSHLLLGLSICFFLPRFRISVTHLFTNNPMVLITLSVINTVYESPWDSIFSPPRFLLLPVSWVQVYPKVQCSQMRWTNRDVFL